ncbi:hypothetical protein TL16_g09094 [Triparma laevis f. inornata]|uniref:Uncharacterized protein n=1 Tax=Triparma laevis f. inornata TaxID=1714386 RepID=A0A9W7EL82_9STRA|nr:hypothetical protein TL16_g09094 [Triparma laevis f. inornata]
MSKSVASESNEGYKIREMSRKRGSRDEEKQNEEGILDHPPAESSTTSTPPPTAPVRVDEFMFTESFMIHFVEYVQGDTLMRLRLATKGYNAAADALIDKGVESGTMIVHGGNDLSFEEAFAREERHALVTRAIFLLDITKIGDRACCYATNLVDVEIPEGIKSIGMNAFRDCWSLTTVSFPTTLISIGRFTFVGCEILESVDLFHTNLQELGRYVFWGCSELKSITIPLSLQTLGDNIFYQCSKLVPSHIDVNDQINKEDVTSEVIDYINPQLGILMRRRLETFSDSDEFGDEHEYYEY